MSGAAARGPWEDYAGPSSQATEDGPWMDYAVSKPTPKPVPVTAKGLAKAGASGALSGVAGIADAIPFAPVGASNLIKQGGALGNFAVRKLGLQTQAQSDQNNAALTKFRTSTVGPTAGEMQQDAGLVHAPQNEPERYAAALGAFLPNLAMGPAGAEKGVLALGARVAKQVALPAATSETARYATEKAGGGPVAQMVAGVLGGFGGGVLGGVRPSSPRAPGVMAEKVLKFEQANVRPSLAAVGGPNAAKLGKMAAENVFTGGKATANFRASLDDTSREVNRQANAYGALTTPVSAGATIQQGVKRFAQETFSKKAEALYNPVFQEIQNGQAARAAAIARLKPDQLTGRSVTVPLTTTAATRGALHDVLTRIKSPNVSDVFSNPKIAQIADALKADKQAIPFEDLRAMRTSVREMQKDEALRQNISSADLQRLESGLTQDIYANARKLGGAAAEGKLKRADQFYRAGMTRINGALQKFSDGGPRNVPEENTFDAVIRAAGDAKGADLGRLTSLKRSLPPSEWGEVSATALGRMGKPSSGAVNAGAPDAFSINNFVTNYAKLSPQGKDILFGSRGGGGAKASELRSALDNLAEVAGMQKSVEAAANHSGSGTVVQGVATGTGIASATTAALLGQPLGLVPVGVALGSWRAVGNAMSNPSFVRWLSGAAKLKPGSPEQTAYAAKLDRLAKADASLQPIAQQYRRALLAGGLGAGMAMPAATPVAAQLAPKRQSPKTGKPARAPALSLQP